MPDFTDTRRGHIIPEIERHLQEEMYDLGWENQTSWLDKVQDVELLEATGADYRFLRTHQKVRAILDCMDRLADDKLTRGNLIKKLSMNDLYMRFFKTGATEIPAYRVNQYGELSGEPPVDLIKEARFERIVQVNDLLGSDKLSAEDLRTQYDAAYPDGDLITFAGVKNRKGQETGKVNRVNLMQSVESPQITPDEFKYYFEVIKKNQTQLQILGTLRDAAITNHHSENGGHAQGEMIDGEMIYVPVGSLRASAYVRGDVRKKAVNFRANGHPHELGHYEEHTCALVKVSATTYQDFRYDVKTTRIHGDQTHVRTRNNLLALASEETAPYDKETMTFRFGNDGKGLIYGSMRYHYDGMMERVRGYGITDEEIGDKIVTDILAVSITKNKLDFLMNFAAAAGIKAELAISDEFISGGKKDNKTGNIKERNQWSEKPVFHFNAKRPVLREAQAGESEIKYDFNFDNVGKDRRGRIMYDYGPVDIKGVQALLNYIEWRIKMGEVPGIWPDTTIEREGKTEDELRREAQEQGDEVLPAVEEAEATYSETDLDKIVFGLKAILGEDGLRKIKADAQRKVASWSAFEVNGRRLDFNLEAQVLDGLEAIIRNAEASVVSNLGLVCHTTEPRGIAQFLFKFIGQLRNHEALYDLFQRHFS